jgi:hypothetical protein
MPLAAGHQEFDLACSQGSSPACYVRLIGYNVVIDNLYVALTEGD